MGDREYKAKGTISKVDQLKKISPPCFCNHYCIIGSLDLDFFCWPQEDTFEEEALEEKETCDDWQQLQKLGLWDVVCGSGIQFKGNYIRAKEPTF